MPYCLRFLCDTVSNLADDESVAREVPLQNLRALFRRERVLDRLLRALFAEEGDAAAAARAADLSTDRSVPHGLFDEVFHVRRRDVGREPFAVRVGGAHDLADTLPVGDGERLTHLARRVANLLKEVEDDGVALDVRLEHLPVVDARKPRLARVADDDSPLDLFGVNVNRLAPDARGLEVDGVRVAVERAVVVLKSRGHADHLRLDVGGDDDELARRVAVADQPVERADARDGERAGTSQTCARGRGALGYQMKTSLRFEEVDELRDEFEPLLAREFLDV